MSILLSRLISASMIAGGTAFYPNFGLSFMPRMGKVGISKEGLPRFYPGAKLARKAKQKAVAVKHPRGLRADGITV